MRDKICLILMGYGVKTDVSTGGIFDLDLTYRYIIQPAVLQAGYKCVRSDQIHKGGEVDRTMHALLMQADLVIANVSSNNPDAIYELGIRNAYRPFSSIIIKEKGIGKMPFDLDHTRMFTYAQVGKNMGTDELRRSVNGLSGLIHKVAHKHLIDTSLLQWVNYETPFHLTEEEYQSSINELTEKEHHLLSILDKANQYKQESDFENASIYWEKAMLAVPQESYFVEQFALSRYKSKTPSYSSSLAHALLSIESLHPTNDPETLSIAGAIYKNMYLNNGDIECLNSAIDCYGKGFKVSNSYYAGENYALCLNIKAALESNQEEKNYYKVEASKTKSKIIESLEEMIQSENFDQRIDKKWMFATLAHCYYSVEDETATFFEKKFLESAAGWEKQTYFRNKEQSFRAKGM